MPIVQQPRTTVFAIARTRGPLPSLSLEAALHDLDRTVPVFNDRTVDALSEQVQARLIHIRDATFLLIARRDWCRIDMSNIDMSKDKSDLPHDTLDLCILRTLDTMGPLHGYNIARRIEQAAGGTMRLSQGAIYPALIRLEQQGWIRATWGVSETNRKVKIYELTRTGARQLRDQIASWEHSTALVARFLGAKA